MNPLPSNAQIQKLITTHPHGVSGPPLAVAWSTHHPGTLVIIDTVGHKLIFENASPLPQQQPSPPLGGRPGGGPQGEDVANPATPNKQGEKLPASTKKTGETQLNTPNKKEPVSPKPTNKPQPAKPVGARHASPASPASKSKSKPSPSGRGQGEGTP